MSISRTIRALAVTTLAGAVLLSAGCTEPVATKVERAPEPTMEARLVSSDSAPAIGTMVDVFAHVRAATPELIGSFTARLRFDSTALGFREEIALPDGVLRATNATGGLLRFAGAAPRGVPDGRLAGFRFVVLKTKAMQSMQLVVDEMHTVARTNAASQLRATPTRVEVAP